MKLSPVRCLDAFRGVRVLVVGEAMLDSYLEGASSRLCPEAPVPVVAVSGRSDAPGGAANTAVNVRALGASVSFLSVVGDDDEAAALRRSLEKRGVDTSELLVQPGRRTLAKQRVCAGGQILVRFDQGDTDLIDSSTESRLLDRLTELFPACDALIISDYGYGVLCPATIAAIARLQAQHARVVVADSRRLPVYRQVGLTALKPNFDEAMQLLGRNSHELSAARPEYLAAHGRQLLQATGARIVAVTLDKEGALVFERGEAPQRLQAYPGPRLCTSGAGDTFVSALTLSLAAGADALCAAQTASVAAALVVGKKGTASCSAAELKGWLAAGGACSMNRLRLSAELEDHRQNGRRIVFTNGCFDILHRGHVTYLRRARDLGDILVVGVNTDASIRRLKGPGRPINKLEDRLAVLAALRFVDYLVPFDEETPHELIRVVRPDIFVKGGDYTRARLPEATLVEELGGVVHILPLLEDRSTTRLIEQIRGALTVPVPALNGPATS
jgi:D-beta-D-heptose 7-phosphate kinase / D-beta-D-heptose 1-phosphate adenosyltransferase